MILSNISFLIFYIIQFKSDGPIGTIAGLVCIGIGASTAFFGINDITESVLGDNLIKDVWGMSEEAYKWTELGLNIASTVCTIGGSALNKKLNKPKPKPLVQDPPAPPTDTP